VFVLFHVLVLCGGSAVASAIRVQACAGSPTYVLRAVVLSFPLCAPFVWSGAPVLPLPLSPALLAAAPVVSRKDSGAVHTRTAGREGMRLLNSLRILALTTKLNKSLSTTETGNACLFRAHCTPLGDGRATTAQPPARAESTYTAHTAKKRTRQDRARQAGHRIARKLRKLGDAKRFYFKQQCCVLIGVL
jgi:hypothetical protein